MIGKLSLAVLAAWLVVGPVVADHGTYIYDVVPGDATVDTARLRDYQANWSQLQRSEDGLTDSGTVFTERLVRSGGQMEHTQTVLTAQGIKLTAVRQFDRATLRPLSLKRSIENGPPQAPLAVSLVGDGLNWSGQASMADGTQTPFEFAAQTDAFDGWVVGLTLAALPLADGYQAQLPAMVQMQRATYLLTATVSGRRQFQTSDGTNVPVWVVDTEWINVVDHSASAAGADQAGGSYLIAIDPAPGQPHVIEYANNGAVIRWQP